MKLFGRAKNMADNEIPTSQDTKEIKETKGETKMAKEIQENEEVMTVKDPETKKDVKVRKVRRKLNPIVKWALIGCGAAIIIGGVVYLVVGKKAPAKAIEKTAEVVAEVAAAA